MNAYIGVHKLVTQSALGHGSLDVVLDEGEGSPGSGAAKGKQRIPKAKNIWSPCACWAAQISGTQRETGLARVLPVCHMHALSFVLRWLCQGSPSEAGFYI